MSFHLIRAGKASQGDIWPLGVDSAAGGFLEVASWRQFGMSWFAGAYDDVGGLERTTRFTERLAGVLHLDSNAIANEAASGAALMQAGAPASPGIGWGRILQRVKPISTHQQRPWECNRFGVESLGFGVNDLGTGGIQNSGSFWPEQRDMWNYVWANTIRSCIQRFIAGAIYYAGSTGLSQAVWHNVPTLVTNPNPPPAQITIQVPTADFSFLPKGPGGVGIGGWQWKTTGDAAFYGTSGGYWWTPNNGDEMWLTIPVDYDTGTIAIRHLAPGSYFDGPVQTRNPFGTTGGSSAPQIGIRTGAEHVRAASAVTVTAAGYAGATVDCRGLANRMEYWGTNPGPGIINGALKAPPDQKDFVGPDAMTLVSRHALAPTPGDTQLVKVIVGGLPAGGWYGFDSWEIEAIPMLRPIVPVANVATPADLGLYFWTTDTYAMFAARCQDYSDTIANVVAEYADPGIMVADIRAAIATAPTSYAYLKDGAGAVVEVSSASTTGGALGGTGDGTHPHGLGERLIVGMFLDTILKANLPRGRGALPFAPGRSLAYARSSGG